MGRWRRRWLWLEEEGEEEDDMMIVRVGDGWERQQDDSVAGVMAGASKVSEATCQRIPCARISCANEYLIHRPHLPPPTYLPMDGNLQIKVRKESEIQSPLELGNVSVSLHR
jgi:hypothetical protein